MTFTDVLMIKNKYLPGSSEFEPRNLQTFLAKNYLCLKTIPQISYRGFVQSAAKVFFMRSFVPGDLYFVRFWFIPFAEDTTSVEFTSAPSRKCKIIESRTETKNLLF